MTFKLGLDMHGVIDDDPVFFAGLSKLKHFLGQYFITEKEKQNENC